MAFLSEKLRSELSFLGDLGGGGGGGPIARASYIGLAIGKALAI